MPGGRGQLASRDRTDIVPRDRSVEDLDRMGAGEALAAFAKNLADLQSATGVGGGEKVGPNRENVVGLAPADFLRARGFDQVIDARAAAALIAVGDLEK